MSFRKFDTGDLIEHKRQGVGLILRRSILVYFVWWFRANEIVHVTRMVLEDGWDHEYRRHDTWLLAKADKSP